MNDGANKGTHALAHGVSHYENFPVASFLCPPKLRPAVAAIYWFARTADDIADEGDAHAVTRLADLAAYHDDLRACAAGPPCFRTLGRCFHPPESSHCTV